MPPEVVLKLARPRRRVDRHRHPSRQQHPEKAVKIIRARGQHQGDALPRLQPLRHQPGGDPPCPVGQRLIAEGRLV